MIRAPTASPYFSAMAGASCVVAAMTTAGYRTFLSRKHRYTNICSRSHPFLNNMKSSETLIIFYNNALSDIYAATRDNVLLRNIFTIRSVIYSLARST